MAAYAAHTTNENTHLLTAKKIRGTQNSLDIPFGKWRFREKEVRTNGPKAEKDKTERATGLGRRTKEEI